MAGEPDENVRQQLMNEFDDLGERVNDMLASYRRRVDELAQPVAPLVPPPAQQPADVDNDAANAINVGNAGQVNDPNNAADPNQAPLVPPAAAPAIQPAAMIAGQPIQVHPGMNISVNVPFQPHQIQKKWGKFDGNPLSWFDFKQRFQLAVHNVEQVPRTNKMAFLRDALTGEGAEAMKGFGIDPDRYDDFWNALVAKYEQRYNLACIYLSRFFGLPRLNRGFAAADLRRMSNDTNGLLRQMRELGYATGQWDLLLVHTLQDRLSQKLKRKWSTVRNGNDNPTIAMMTQFIDDEADALANRAYYQPPPPPQAQAQAYGAVGGAIARHPPAGAPAQAYPCGVCGSMAHLPPTCPEFRPLTLEDRIKVANSSRICFNCLKRGHGKASCFDLRRCREPACRADNAHNSLLCPVKNPPEYAQTVRYETPPAEYVRSFERSLDAGPAPIDGSSSIPDFGRHRVGQSAGRGRGTVVRQSLGKSKQN